MESPASSPEAAIKPVAAPVAVRNEPPPEVLCPITCELMRDPVVTADGHSYERSAIASWIERGNATSPLTGEPLAHTHLVPNHLVRALCLKYVDATG